MEVNSSNKSSWSHALPDIFSGRYLPFQVAVKTLVSGWTYFCLAEPGAEEKNLVLELKLPPLNAALHTSEGQWTDSITDRVTVGSGND